MTGEIVSEGDVSFINCTSGDLGFISVFIVNAPEISTTVSPTTKQNGTDAPPVKQDQSVYVQFSLNANYDDFINESTKDGFVQQVKAKIASTLGVNQSRITNVTVEPGSIKVIFKLLPGGIGDANTSSLVSALRSFVESGSFVITLNDGRNITANSTSFFLVSASASPPVSPTTQQTTVVPHDTNPTTSESSGLSEGAMIAIIVVSCLLALALIVGIILFVRMKNQRAKVQAREEQIHMQQAGTSAQPTAQPTAQVPPVGKRRDTEPGLNFCLGRVSDQSLDLEKK